MTHKIIKKALKIMESEAKQTGKFFAKSEHAKDYCRLSLGLEKEEVFMCIFLTHKNELISVENLFRGSVAEATIYIRVILRKIIEHNASKIILSHNHPSGNSSPSRADISITKSIKDVLSYVDCEVIDHIIVTKNLSYSFAENNEI